MAREQRDEAQVAALLATMSGPDEQPIFEACVLWMSASPRFRAFLAQHATKIAKKLRNAAGAEGRRDLLLELYAAHRLLLDRRNTLAYETYTAGKTRGPDFSLVFKTRTAYNVEVKRLRAAGPGDFSRWAYVLCDKLGQMPPSAINTLLIGCDDAGGAPDAGVARAMGRLRTVAERKDDEFFVKRGVLGAKDYLRQLTRLSGIVLVAGWQRPAGGVSALWVNPQAKHPLPPDLQRALAECF